MTEEIILRKKDIEKFGKNLIKKINKFLHDEYILTFPEMKTEQEKFDKLLTEIKKEKLIFIPYFIEKHKSESVSESVSKSESKSESVSESVSESERLSLSIEEIYYILDRVDLDFEIDEDLYCEKKAYLYLFSVFDHYYTYLIKH